MAQMKTIGIIGGGQLGRMLTLAALPLGFKVIVVDPGANSPAAQVGAAQIVANCYDAKALHELAERVDYITVETEHLDTAVLTEIAQMGKLVNPAPGTIALIQDKLAQKRFLEKNDIPVAPFVEITNVASAEATLRDFDGKMLLKTRHGAYDGRGNMVVGSTKDIKKAFVTFGKRSLYAEKFVPFSKELAVMVARGLDGETAIYPVVETIQQRNICVEVLAPAQISPELTEKARQVALELANHLEGAGVFGIELFLTDDDQIIVNEIAPRVHNSGHYTTEACVTSQFEQHVRAVTGLPLGPTNMIVPAAVMINILGERDGATEVTGRAAAEAIPAVKVHLYGKSPTKIDRKMAHLTAVGATVNEARQRAREARALISI